MTIRRRRRKDSFAWSLLTRVAAGSDGHRQRGSEYDSQARRLPSAVRHKLLETAQQRLDTASLSTVALCPPCCGGAPRTPVAGHIHGGGSGRCRHAGKPTRRHSERCCLSQCSPECPQKVPRRSLEDPQNVPRRSLEGPWKVPGRSLEGPWKVLRRSAGTFAGTWTG